MSIHIRTSTSQPARTKISSASRWIASPRLTSEPPKCATSRLLAFKCTSARKSQRQRHSRMRSKEWRQSCESFKQNTELGSSASVAAWESFTGLHSRVDQANGGTTMAANHQHSASAITLRQSWHPCASFAFVSWWSPVAFLSGMLAFCSHACVTSKNRRRKSSPLSMAG